MLHVPVRETLCLYGNVAEVSAESTEHRHVSLKTLFAKVEPGPRAAVQVLAAEIKREVALNEHFKTNGASPRFRTEPSSTPMSATSLKNASETPASMSVSVSLSLAVSRRMLLSGMLGPLW
jgi:hypothetical protein